MQRREDVWGHVRLKSGGGQAVIEQGGDAVAVGQMQEVGPINDCYADRDVGAPIGAPIAQEMAESVGGGDWGIVRAAMFFLTDPAYDTPIA